MSTLRIDGGTTATNLMERLLSYESYEAGLSDRTKSEYIRKMSAVEKEIRKLYGECTPYTLATYLKQIVATKEIAQATARSMKAASLYWITEQSHTALHNDECISEYENAFEEVKKLPTKHLPTSTLKTSSPKAKFIERSTIDLITTYAEKRRSKHAGTLVACLRANVLVGLRPEEWFEASFFSYLPDQLSNTDKANSNHVVSIAVTNSKNTHGRANGDYREILLHGVSKEEFGALLHFRKLIQAHAEQSPKNAPLAEVAKSFFKPLQQTMSRILKIMGHQGQMPTIYSTRHQAVANAKFSGMTDREIAAMFGHGSIRTAKSHYGRKSSGWMKTSFRPSKESLAAVASLKLGYGDLAFPDRKTIKTASEWLKGRSNS